jgi:hypothetical protein
MEEVEDDDHGSLLPLVFDNTRHTTSLILNGLPLKDIPTQGPSEDSPPNLLPGPEDSPLSAMLTQELVNLQAGQTFSTATQDDGPFEMVLTTMQELEDKKAKEDK